MLLLSVRANDDFAYNWRLTVVRFTGKHSPDEPNTIKRPRLPDAVGPGFLKKNHIFGCF